ncbi:MAG: large protein, partial [Flaviaesturariibacter sp.]|nr:large protein [Flaviaesturariibacter sp.]
AGFENFTNLSATFQPSTSNTISISVANATANDEVYVWIDYNQNGSFDDAGELVYASAAGVGPFTSPISIPALSANVLKGRTRMRVRLQNNASVPTNNTSCGLSNLGQVEDYSIDIQPCQPAAFTVQPTNLVVCNGSGGIITATAAGTGLTYQWQISTDGGATFSNLANGGIYGGTTTGTLTLSSTTTALNANRYRVVVNGTCTASPLMSSVSTLSVNTPGAITGQPAVNTKVCVGNTATITAAASGSQPSYQWQVSRDGGITYTDLATGGTAATLSLANATMADNGNRYRVVATIASCGSAVSQPTILTVSPLPVVTLSVAPVNEIKPGQNTFITAGSVPAAASYVWTRNGLVVAGATGSSINANINGLGSYQAIVTDVNGCTNKSSIQAVTALPSYDLFIYPNPSNGIFQVRLYQPSLTDWRTVRIFNSEGVLVASREFSLFSNVDPYLKMDFDLSHAASGIYFVVLTHRLWTPTVAGKIIISH